LPEPEIGREKRERTLRRVMTKSSKKEGEPQGKKRKSNLNIR